MNALTEVLPDIFTWHWFSAAHGYDFNGYLLSHSTGNLCIDPVEMSDTILAQLAADGVTRILLTNRNHFRASAKLRERTGARVAIHPADATFVRERGVVPDEDLVVGQKVGPLLVLPAQGKSPGEVALHWWERRILFVGDACVGKPSGALTLLPEKVIDDPSMLRSTLRRLLSEVDFDALLLADGAPILAHGQDALRRLVSTFPL